MIITYCTHIFGITSNEIVLHNIMSLSIKFLEHGLVLLDKANLKAWLVVNSHIISRLKRDEFVNKLKMMKIVPKRRKRTS